MKADVITFEKLCNYAQNAKNETANNEEQVCFKIIKSIIDELRIKREVIVRQVKEYSVMLNKTSFDISVDNLVEITLEDIKTIIDKIPALEASL